MPLDAIRRYLETVNVSIDGLRNGYLELYVEEILASNRANLRIRFRFINGCLLEINESITHQDRLQHLSYRYHFQNESSELIFRYDNAPHFPDLPTFPNHKHLPNGVEAFDRPNVADVIKEAGKMIDV